MDIGSILPSNLADFYLLQSKCLRSYCIHRLEETAAPRDTFLVIYEEWRGRHRSTWSVPSSDALIDPARVYSYPSLLPCAPCPLPPTYIVTKLRLWGKTASQMEKTCGGLTMLIKDFEYY